MLNSDLIDKIYYNYIPLFMNSFKQVHRELKWYKIHKELKNQNYLNLTEIIFLIDFDYIYIIRLPILENSQ